MSFGVHVMLCSFSISISFKWSNVPLYTISNRMKDHRLVFECQACMVLMLLLWPMPPPLWPTGPLLRFSPIAVLALPLNFCLFLCGTNVWPILCFLCCPFQSSWQASTKRACLKPILPQCSICSHCANVVVTHCCYMWQHLIMGRVSFPNISFHKVLIRPTRYFDEVCHDVPYISHKMETFATVGHAVRKTDVNISWRKQTISGLSTTDIHPSMIPQ